MEPKTETVEIERQVTEYVPQVKTVKEQQQVTTMVPRVIEEEVQVQQVQVQTTCCTVPAAMPTMRMDVRTCCTTDVCCSNGYSRGATMPTVRESSRSVTDAVAALFYAKRALTQLEGSGARGGEVRRARRTVARLSFRLKSIREHEQGRELHHVY